jgi:uncharacterized protein (TIGR03437 family)
MTSKRSSIATRACAPRVVTALTIISIAIGLGWRQAAAASTNRPEAKLISVPLSFEPNQGQLASTVQFLSRGSGYALFLTPGQVVLNLELQQPAASVDTLRMSLIGANPTANAVGQAPQPGVVSYFIGNDPKNWRSGIPTYGKVKYPQIYPGVDLVFYGNQRQLEYDFVVAPGADPSRIAWRIDGAHASVDAQGNLALSAPNGPASFNKPVLYQLDGDRKTSVEGSFAVAGNEVRFRLGSYDHSKALIVDPVLSYASYLGGSGNDHIGWTTGPGNLDVGTSQGIALDSAGSVYVAGDTYSIDFPTENPYQSAPPAKVSGVSPGLWPSAFVTKFSPDGKSLVYSTYLGGNGYDYVYAIAVDSSGNAYVTGQTNSANFPVTNGAYQTVCDPAPSNQGPPYTPTCYSSNVSAFVTKLNATGTGLVYSTFLGGYAYAYATAIAVDGAGRAYVAGNEAEYCSIDYTFQSCFPTTSGAVIGGDKTGGGSPQYAFLAAFDPTGAQLLYSTIFGDLNGLSNGPAGPGGTTWGTGVAVDANGYFYLIGETSAGKLPTTTGVIQPSAGPLGSTGTYVEAYRGFVAKFTPVTSAGGASLAYATYLGGYTEALNDYISGIAIDSASNAYLVGYTNSPDFPVTAGAYSTVCGPNGQNCSAAHVTKLNPTGSAILWSTFVGDAKGDSSDALFFTGPIQLDGKGNIYIIGQVGFGFPMVNPVEPSPAGGDLSVLVAELDSTGANLLFSTTIGADGRDTASPAGLAVDSAGNIYLAGNDAGPDLITTPGAFQTTSPDNPCCNHGFVVKIAPTVAPAGPTVALATAGQVEPFAAESIVSAYGTDLATGQALATTLPLPTSLDGNSVTVTDSAGVARPAYLFYVSPSQINFEIPAGTATGAATVAFQNQNGTAQSESISIGSVSPGIFELTGAGLVAAWVLPVISGVQQTLQPVYQSVAGSTVPLPLNLGPSTEQVYLEMYGTGIRYAKSVTVTVGGLNVPVLYHQAAPGFAGEDQVNIGPLPQSLAGQGSVNILLTADGQAANTVTLTIQ